MNQVFPEPIVAETKHSHYKKDVRHIAMLDVYRVLDLFQVTHPALQHAAKKILLAGARGAKDWDKDVQEAIDSLQRAQQMRQEDKWPPKDGGRHG